jgi:hypothetical protein
MASGAESELIKFTKLKTKRGEARQNLLIRLLAACEEKLGASAPDADTNWEELSEAAQDWYGRAIKASERDVAIPEFREVVEASAEAVKPSPAETPAKAPPPALPAAAVNGAKADASKDEVVDAPKQRAAGKKRGREGTGVVDTIQNACFTNPTKNPEQIQQMLAKEGIDAKPGTIWSVRTGLQRAVKYLHRKGLLADNPFKTVD